MKTCVSGPHQVGSLCWDRLWDDIISNNEWGRRHINTTYHVAVTQNEVSTLWSKLKKLKGT